VGTDGEGDSKRREIQKEIDREEKELRKEEEEVRKRHETIERLKSKYANTL
jgi:hypothetical protein